MPSQREFIFSPGAQYEIPFAVVNSPTIRVSAYTSTVEEPSTVGTPEDNNVMRYVTLVDPDPDGPPRGVALRFDLPQQLRPGRYEIYVLSSEVAPSDGGTVGSMAASRLMFTLHVLRQDKFIELTSFQALPVPQGVSANATIGVVSRTLQDISSIAAEIRLYRDGALIKSVWSTPEPLPSKESALLIANIDTDDLTGGDYDINATIHYDGNSIDSWSETLKVGTLHVRLVNHSPTLTYNTTNRLFFSIGNEWNRELRDVYAEVRIGAQTKKSPSQNIPPFGQTQYDLYIDRDESLLPGRVDVNISVTFQDYDSVGKRYVTKSESFTAPIDIILPPEPEQGWLEKNMVYIGVGIVVLLFIMMVVIIVLLLRRPKERAPLASSPRVPPSNAQAASQAPSVRPVSSAAAQQPSKQASPASLSSPQTAPVVPPVTSTKPVSGAAKP
ncbi:TPA: hypothetical protein HA251_07245 [Candidatus Woesearchaeota archaeon]|nr:hypothetical protein [Candidatus Woesearchaeota archaeon]